MLISSMHFVYNNTAIYAGFAVTSLKEDARVDIPTAITPMSSTQLIILWTLLGFLLTWMLFFALLAVCPEVKKKAERNDAPVHTPVQGISPAPTKLQVVTTQSGTYMSTAVGAASNETPLALEQSK
jgi:hypothetical protein